MGRTDITLGRSSKGRGRQQVVTAGARGANVGARRRCSRGGSEGRGLESPPKQTPGGELAADLVKATVDVPEGSRWSWLERAIEGVGDSDARCGVTPPYARRQQKANKKPSAAPVRDHPISSRGPALDGAAISADELHFAARSNASALRLALEAVPEHELVFAMAHASELCALPCLPQELQVPILLALAREIERRQAPRHLARATLLKGPTDVVQAAGRWLGSLDQEHFICIGVDARQCVRSVRTVAIGSLAQVDVHPRELFRPMLLACAHSILLIHNHPSGDPEPSEADLSLTRRMVDAGKLLGVPVLDHVIIAGALHVSLAARGLI